MKRLKRLAIALCVTMLATMLAAPAFAANSNTHTITIANAPAGHTYEAYQVFAGDLADGKLANITWGSGVDAAALLAELQAIDDFAECESAKDVAIVLEGYDNDSAEIDAFAQIVYENLSTTVAGSSTSDGTSCAISVVGDGYYLLKDKDESVTSQGDAYTKAILEVIADVTVTPKSDAPTIAKKILEGGTEVDFNHAAVGDSVSYVVTSRVPAMDGYGVYTFIVHDTLDKGLSFNDDVAITIGETALAPDAFAVSKSNGPDGTTLTITLDNFISYKNDANAEIKITYSATLNEEAVIGANGNVNTAWLQYSNNPNVDGVTGETVKDSVITYATGIKITKVDEDGLTLSGAQFKLEGTALNKVQVNTERYEVSEAGSYYALVGGAYTTIAPTEATKQLYSDTTTKYSKSTISEWVIVEEQVEAVSWTNESGIVIFNGLAAGDYTITETVTPPGYNTIEPIELTVTWTEPQENSIACAWGATAKTANEHLNNLVVETGIITFEVINEAGSVLPSTGGVGVVAFYIAGALLVAISAIALVVRRRTDSSK